MSDEKICFVICPIGEEGSDIRKRSDDVFTRIIEPAAKKCGYKAMSANHIQKPGLITHQILEQILRAPLVIADLTDQNPNVFYELAIRHTRRLPFVHVIDEDQAIPFDNQDVRTIYINHKNPEKIDASIKEITAHIKATEKNPQGAISPISVVEDLL